MTTNYDPIAEQYQRSKQQPWRTHIESFSLLSLVGDISNKSLLDLACGEGFYTRQLKQLGASRVVGVDLSEEMIRLAQTQEDRLQLGIEYHRADARDLSFEEEFDLATAAYLLNYARTREELQSMCRGIARAIRPGGRFVTVNCSPLLDFSSAPSYRKYGFETSVIGPWQEGAPIRWTFFLDDGEFDLENYFLRVSTHEEAFLAAGFREVRWHAPQVSPDGISSVGQEYWSTFQDHAPIVLIECLK